MADDKKTVSGITGADLVSDADLAKAKAAKEAAQATELRPVQTGQYIVASHNDVRSLDQLFKAGEPFAGADGDIPGLLKAGALVEV